MKCTNPNCNETNHEPSATYCHLCGAKLSVNLAAISQAEQPKGFEDDLFPIRRNNRIGFINVKGETVIEPRFLKARHFSEGLAAVQFENLTWGFIDKGGTILNTSTTFHDVKDFSEGMAVVKINDEFGYIGKTGKYVVYPQYHQADEFSEGLARVHVLYSGYGYIDRTGNRVIAPKFSAARSFHSGLAAVRRNEKKQRWGFVDQSGKFVIMPFFHDVSDFSDNLALAKAFENGRYHVIGKNGIVLLNHHLFGLPDLVTFNEGMGRLRKNNKYGYVDWENVVIKPRFESAGVFSEGLAAVRESHSQYGYIDTKGEYVIKPQFTEGGSFSEGLAPVRIGKYQWGYIDRKGNIIIEPKFVRASSFSNGLAVVSSTQTSGMLFYINKLGEIISSNAIR